MVKFICDVGIKQYGKRNHMFALFQCPICGNVFERPKFFGKDLTACRECFYKNLKLKNQKHGQRHTRLHRTWSNMRSRCNNPNDQHFKYYGAKGIKICSEWDDFMVFREFALEKGYTDELTIDRIDPAGNYEPDNIQFIPNEINAGKDKIVISKEKYFIMKQENEEKHIPLKTIFKIYNVSKVAYYNARRRYE